MTELTQTIKDRFSSAEKYQQTYFDKFSRFDDLYNSKFNSAYATPNGSKVFLPFCYGAVETVMPRMFSADPILNYLPREKGDVKQAQILSDLFKYWWYKSRAFLIVQDWIKSALIYGTGILKISWDYKVKNQNIRDKDKITTNPKVMYDDPKIENVNIYDWFFDPTATNMMDMQWCIHRYYTTIDELEAEQENLEAQKKALVEKNEPKEANKISLYNDIDRLRNKISGKVEKSSYEKDRKVSVGGEYQDEKIDEAELWQMWEADGNIITYSPQLSKVIRTQKQPYWHGKLGFILINDTRVPREVYGKGEIEPIEKLQHAANTITNQRIDNINFILNPMWKVTGEVNDAELVPSQGGIVHLQQGEDAKQVEMQPVTTAAYNELEFLRNQIQDTLGITDYIKGMQTPQQTLGEVEVKTEQAGARIAAKIRLLEDMGLKELGQFVLDLYQQFITDEKVVRITGDRGAEWVTITADDIAGEYDVIPEPKSTESINPEVSKAQQMNLYTLFNGDPLIDQNEIRKDLLEKWGIKDPEKYVIAMQEEEMAEEGMMPQGMEGVPQQTRELIPEEPPMMVSMGAGG
jgi:peptidoglycan hydrolase CwlO-like protein